MTLFAEIPRTLGTAETWVKQGGVHWLTLETTGVRALAEKMNALHARFITITAYQLPKDEGLRLEYLWDLDGQLLGFPFKLAANSIESIFDLCEAADWIEREIHEEYNLDFAGRTYEPLLLRQGDTAGVNLRDAVAASQEKK
jgi:Ni,Fe-hydrogenase III component G